VIESIMTSVDARW